MPDVTTLHQMTDTAAARLFWKLAQVMNELEFPRDVQGDYGIIILIRLAGWLLSHGLDQQDDPKIRQLLELHVNGLKDYVTAATDLQGPEGSQLEALAHKYFAEEGGGIPAPEGHA